MFATANLVAAMAGTSAVVVGARVVAGAGAALIMPVTLSTITSSFPGEKKTRAVGIWSGLAAAGAVLGVVVSSFIVDAVTWPWVFAMPIGMSALALVGTLLFVRNSRERHVGRFDLTGSLLSVLGIGGVVLGIHEGPEKGWSDPLTVAGMGIGLVALAAFVLWDLRAERPLLNVRVFANRSLAAGSVTLSRSSARCSGCSCCWCSTSRRSSATARSARRQVCCRWRPYSWCSRPLRRG